MKYAFMARHRSVWPVRWMGEALGVSASGFYEWLSRPESNRSTSNRALLLRIRESFESSHRTYGSPRVWRDLRDWRVPGGLNRIARIMRQAGLVARPRLRRPDYSVGKRSVIAPNLLDRQFTASAPNQKWVADFTYIATGEGWLYLAVVLDLFNREVIGWSIKPRMTADLVTDALAMAWFRRRPQPGVLFHSDRGSQYASNLMQARLVEYGMTGSMSRKGNCWDNAPTESFFNSLKNERVHGARYKTRAQAAADLFEYIAVFYNRRRRHSTLGYCSPTQFLQDWLSKHLPQNLAA